MSQIGWRLFQIAIVGGVAYAARNTKASPIAIMLVGGLCAAVLTGILAALFRLVRRAAGRGTVEDRIWRTAPTPRSNLAPPDDII